MKEITMEMANHPSALRRRARVLVIVLLLAGRAAAAQQDAAVPSAWSEVDLTRVVRLHVQQQSISQVVDELGAHQHGRLGGNAVRLIFADDSVWYFPVSIDIPPMPLRHALDALCAQEHLRWMVGSGEVLIDHPLPAQQLQAMVQALGAGGVAPDAPATVTAAAAANRLMRCGDRDGVLALVAALGDGALDQVTPAQAPAAMGYQQALIDAMGSVGPALYPGPEWNTTRAWQVLGTLPTVHAAMARAWARAGRQGLAYTPLLCYLVGAAGVDEAIPVLRQLAVQPESVVHELDPHGQRQALELAQIRLCAIWSLGELGDRVSIAPLTAVLSQNPQGRLATMIIDCLGCIGDHTSADTVSAWSAGADHQAQSVQYLALARLRPTALAMLLARTVPARGSASAQPPLPEGWWEGILALPVAEIIPAAFQATTLAQERDPNPRWDALCALVDRPALAQAVVSAARTQLASASEDNLRHLDRLLLAYAGDASMHAAILAEAISGPAAVNWGPPWQMPLMSIGDLTATEEDQLAGSPLIEAGRWDALWALRDRGTAMLARLAQTLPHTTGDQQHERMAMLLDHGEPNVRAAVLAALAPPTGSDGAVAITELDTLPDWGTGDPMVARAITTLLTDPRPALARRAALWLSHDWVDDSVLPQLLEWERRQKLEDLPPALVRAPSAPWSVPGPLRQPLRLPFAVYDQQARLVLGWDLSSPDPGVRRTLTWWLGIHTQETQRPYRVAVVKGLMHLAEDRDTQVVQQARDHLASFLALTIESRESATDIALAGSDDDRASLRELDALIPQVQAVLAHPTDVHPARPGF
jgi:hypothetical protein